MLFKHVHLAFASNHFNWKRGISKIKKKVIPKTDFTGIFITIQWRNESYTFIVSNWNHLNQPTEERWQVNSVVYSKQTTNDHNPLIRSLSVIIFFIKFVSMVVCGCVCRFTIKMGSLWSVWCLNLSFSVWQCIILLSMPLVSVARSQVQQRKNNRSMPFGFSSPAGNGKIEWQTVQRPFTVWRFVVNYNIWTSNILKVEGNKTLKWET